jgi:hypothetical protein
MGVVKRLLQFIELEKDGSWLPSSEYVRAL